MVQIRLTGMASIRSKSEQSEQLKDITYTIVPGETKKNYCKIMTNVRSFTFSNSFTLGYVKDLILRYGKKRKEHQYRSGEIRSEREALSVEEADSIISDLIRSGYLKYLKTQHRDKIHPNIPDEGLKYYIFDNFKVIECEQSKYFQSKKHKKVEKLEAKGTINERRCRALRQIYAQFGDKVPFTYEMVLNIPKFYKKIAEDKTQEISEESRVYYRVAAQNAESRNIDFLDTWNSLFHNNFLVPYKVRAKDGNIKIRQGAYKINMVYVRQCLAAQNL